MWFRNDGDDLFKFPAYMFREFCMVGLIIIMPFGMSMKTKAKQE